MGEGTRPRMPLDPVLTSGSFTSGSRLNEWYMKLQQSVHFWRARPVYLLNILVSYNTVDIFGKIEGVPPFKTDGWDELLHQWCSGSCTDAKSFPYKDILTRLSGGIFAPVTPKQCLKWITHIENTLTECSTFFVYKFLDFLLDNVSITRWRKQNHYVALLLLLYFFGYDYKIAHNRYVIIPLLRAFATLSKTCQTVSS